MTGDPPSLPPRRSKGLRLGLKRLFGLGPQPAPISPTEELRDVIEQHVANDEAVKDERAMLRSILDLNRVGVGEIMTHRRRVVTLNVDAPVEHLVGEVLASPHTRLPLWRGEPDNIIGVLHAKALLRAIRDRGGDAGGLDIAAIANAPWFVPETTSLLAQLRAFRERKEHFALVVDEYGELMGIVTLEDILEEIVGDIVDEHDVSVVGVRPHADGTLTVQGMVTLRDLNREFGWHLPDGEASTLAGLLLYESRRIPEIGQVFMFHGFRFEVLRRQRHQITSIRITPPASEPTETEGAAA